MGSSGAGADEAWAGCRLCEKDHFSRSQRDRRNAGFAAELPVQTLLDYLEGGETIDDFLEGFPTVSREQVIAFFKTATKRELAAAH